MNYILFDDNNRENLLPLTFTRPVAELRIGILTIKEKWDKYLNTKCSYLTQEYLSVKFPLKKESDNILINGSTPPNPLVIKEICDLKENQALVYNNELIALRLPYEELDNFNYSDFSKHEVITCYNDISTITYPWDIFEKNDKEIKSDFRLLTEGRESAPLSGSNNVLGKENIFLEEGAHVEFATLNASKGPIYIGKDAEIMEGSIVRGSLAMCEGSSLKLGTKIYGATTVGPHSKVGGEVSNSVIIGYSNKGHDGYLGNSVIGEWCNLGAGSSNSNLKNDYSEVRLWSYKSERFIKTGLQFCGLIMGDYSKSGINTMFNTGTVVGVNVNLVGSGFPRNFVESFSWGGAQGYTVYPLIKAFEVVEKVCARRDKVFGEADKQILTEIFNQTSKNRKFK